MNRHAEKLLAMAKEVEEGSLMMDAIAAHLTAMAMEREMPLYSQRDPRWRNDVYAGGSTFGQAGCYVVCIAMIVGDEPPVVAGKLRDAGCFSGAMLSHPNRIPLAYPKTTWNGTIDWRKIPANLDRLQLELSNGPIITEVEFVPGGAEPPDDQHFVIIEAFTQDGEDVQIADPWDGARSRLLERYSLEHWDLARSIYGLRLLKKI